MALQEERWWGMSKEAMKLALEALKKSDDFLYNWHESSSDDEADAYSTARQLNELAFTALREALVEQPAKQDIPDLIAGALGVPAAPVQDIGVEQDERVFARIEARKNRDAAAVKEHSLNDVRCQCCGYMTYHREHMGCIRAAAAAPMQDDLPDFIAGAFGVSRGTAYDLMREALKDAAPVQEPVEILRKDFHRRMKADGHTQTALAILGSGIYLSPTVQNEWENEKKKYIAAQRQWVGLTDEELEKVFPAIATYHEANKTLYRSIARAIEAKLKEKNT